MKNLRIDFIILIIAFVTGLLNAKYEHRRIIKLFPYFLLLSLLVEVTGDFFSSRGQNNMLLFNFFSIVEFILFIAFFREILQGKILKQLANVLLYALPVICLINIFFFQGIHTFHTYTYAAASLTVLIFGAAYFYQASTAINSINPLKTTDFWITAACTFFFATSVSIMGIINYIAVMSKEMIQLSHILLLTVDTVFYVLFFIAFLCQRNSRKSIPNS